MIDISAGLADLGLVQAASFKQTAFVVRDIEASAAAFWDEFRIGPWTGWTLTPDLFRNSHFRGAPGQFSFRHALAWKDGAQFELVQPLAGDSLFSEHLERHGEGLHHIGMYVADIAAARSQMEARGFRAVQGASGFGADGDGCFCYFETDRPIHTIVEIIQAPQGRRPAHFVYPALEQRL